MSIPLTVTHKPGLPRKRKPCPIDHLSPAPEPEVLRKTLDQLVDLSFLDEPDSPPRIDPRLLCPWCDSRLPARPTSVLLRLIEEAKGVSHAAPRSSNALGLKAPFSQYLHVCERHEFENEELPKARAQGWPERINFRKLVARTRELYDVLHPYVLDKSESNFWTELAAKIQKDGTLATLSLSRQYMCIEDEPVAG